MNATPLDVLIVGAGHAGLSASYYLKQFGLDHLVFERGRIGESWSSQRWDSFRMNTANKLNELPGATYWPNDPDGFCSANSFVASLEEYASANQLPVAENVRVVSIEKNDVSGFFEVAVSQQDRISHYSCRQVILASGAMNEKKIPAVANAVSPAVKQLHTGEYRYVSQLPEGAILVVGSAQSGCQIAEDLADAGHTVYLSTSRVARLPRRYRGKDIMDWLILMRFFDMRAEDVPDPAMLHMRTPQLTGTGEGQRSISLQSLARKGVTILGKLEKADEQTVFLQPNAPMHVAFADGFSNQVKGMIDGFIANNQITAPTPEFDPDDVPDLTADCASTIASINLNDHGITSIIWSTGFGGDFSYVKSPILDSDGNLNHHQGLSDIEGLYFLGIPWLRNRQSSLLCGIGNDAKFIAETVYAYSQQREAVSIPNED
jgi:putative flavoprotein involved in K+ transport